MRKWLPFLFLGLFAYDVAIDAFEADCLGTAEASCCACVCQTHATAPTTAESMAAPVASSSHSLSSRTLFTAHLSDKSLFHPPKALA